MADPRIPTMPCPSCLGVTDPACWCPDCHGTGRVVPNPLPRESILRLAAGSRVLIEARMGSQLRLRVVHVLRGLRVVRIDGQTHTLASMRRVWLAEGEA